MNRLIPQVRMLALPVWVAGIICMGGTAPGALADDLKVSQLEQEVRELQRVVQQQMRRIESLENGMRQSRATVLPTPRSAAPTPVSTANPEGAAWQQRANWDKVRLGMTEAEVLRLLGPPTTMRKSKEGETQTLFYALELEAGGFLSGDVILSERRVIDLHKPELK